MSTDRHSEHFMVARGEEAEEFRHLPPSHMARILLGRVKAERRDERARLQRLRGSRPHKLQPCAFTIGPPLMRGLEGNLARLDRKVELLEQLLEAMKEGPTARWWKTVEDQGDEGGETFDGE